MSDDDFRQIQNVLIDDPLIGDIQEETGGIRKFRIPIAKDKGKSGGARIHYYIHSNVCYLIALVPKNVMENLSKAERNSLKDLVTRMMNKEENFYFEENNMSRDEKTLYDFLKNGLEDIIAYNEGDASRAKQYEVKVPAFSRRKDESMKLRIAENKTMLEVDKGYSRQVYKALDDAFKDDAGKAELVYISDAVDMWLFNTEKLYKEIFNNRRKATSIAYEALIDLFQDTVDGYDVKVRVTSEMVKQWFKRAGLDYKEALKPVVDKIEEERAEAKANKKESVRRNRKVREGAYGRGAEYMYVLKHGFGPGTIPRDVNVINTDEVNGYTVIWVDRPFTREELDYYDIPSETQLRRYLGNEYGRYFGESRKSRKRFTMKERSGDRKRYTQKQLKTLVDRGEAVDITRYSFEDADDLWKRGYDVVGVSMGVYGLNGALLKMRDTGELMAITARNTTLSQLV